MSQSWCWPAGGRGWVPGILGLVPVHWWAELGPGVFDCRALGNPGTDVRPSGGRGWDLGGPWVDTSLLVGVVGLDTGRPWGCGGPSTGVCPLVGTTRVKGVPGLVPTHWCVQPGPRVSWG